VSLRARAATGREALQAIAEAFEAVRARALADFERTAAEDDTGRLRAWALLNALDAIRAELRRPIHELEIFEASQGSTSQ
jgi:hypothetical protein